MIGALSRSTTPFDLAVTHLRPERSLSYGPVVQVVFAYHEEGGPAELPGGVRVSRAFVPTDTAKFDLTWSVYRSAEGQSRPALRLEVEYATDLFEPATIAAFAGHWRTLLGEVAASPDVPVGQLALMPAAERQSLTAWSGAGQAQASPETGAAGATVPGLIAEMAEAHPDEVAVSCGRARLTYRELDARSGALARHLRGLGIGPESRVAVLLEPSLETIVACLAVLRAGGAYVPLDPAFPADRIEFMLADAGTGLVLAHSATAGTVPPGPWTVLDLDAGLADGELAGRALFPPYPRGQCVLRHLHLRHHRPPQGHAGHSR